MPAPVGPTRRALSDLNVSMPPLTVELESIDEPLVRKAQQVPDEVEAGGAERVLALDDRVWFKVKTSDERGVAAELPSATDAEVPSSGWWLAAAGHRKADTPKQDFYDRIAEEATRHGKGSGKVSTDHLLPTEFDYRRWKAELATLSIESIHRVVREVIARSALDGKLRTAGVPGYTIGALIRRIDGDSYLAVCAEGYYDANMVAVILRSVPDVNAEDWLAEPGEVLGIKPDLGQIVFSTILPPRSLARLIDDFEDQEPSS